MSRHLSHRLTTVNCAVSMALLYSIGSIAISSSAQAATIGKTVVTSAQHEPLAASIIVTDIKAADFSASLANPIIYQQMGLTPTDSMTVSFRPTSASSGQVLINTTQPVSKPFADVVLAINDGGQRNVIPKTLLMPLDDSIPIKPFNKPSKNIVTGAKKPNLPVISATNAKPLTVRKGAPPPLISTPRATTVTSNLPVIATSAPQSNRPIYAPSRLDNGRLNDSNNVMTTAASAVDISPVDKATSNPVENKVMTNKSMADSTTVNNNKTIAGITDKQFDILNIQITRQIQPSNKTSTGIMANAPASPMPNNNAASTASMAKSDSNSATTAAPSNIPSSAVAAVSPTVNSNTAATINTATNRAISTSVDYQVQRNDSLWVIAQQIAQKNNLDVQTVMKQIQAQNPNAFINKDADQLKADAKLSLPNYEVVPSQQNLEAAINAQRQYRLSANTPTVKKAAPPKPAAKTTTETASETTQAAQNSESPKKPAATKTQILSKARFSVLAPSSNTDKNGNADGNNAKAATATGNGLSTETLATLKASRQEAASQAQRLSKTNNMLDSYTSKLQLQNQKLAELQARLKKLRNQ
ncbi:FimV family protein [Psychrobacter sp. PAMC 21119]|uniref:type IV pilus assembly protein FimV n=1 Tax=Psychrobacter sp. PAMC 21119 TaxID=1112209 RepID=UPI00028A0A6B|nr:peptidoglycan-binding protein LysM [Psychrobacter sp. PAMC 21119]